jgi:hypothetical protein
MTALFLVTAFLSAALLFVVQPMIGKMLLPLLGGAPSVWNTCMVFFQAVLLLGYLYAHLATRWLGARRHALVHIAVMLLPLAVLPMSLSEHAIAAVPRAGNPLPWLLGFLAMTAGLPLFVVSATAPLLQKWFAGTTHPRAHDPYFLYAASNAGSMVGLLSYPALVEPMLRVSEQMRWWAGGFGVLILLVAGCGFVVWRSRGNADVPANVAESADVGVVTWRRRLRWIALAFVPSSLMLGVTTYLTTDVAPLPLFWVVPLALYLCTFILVFARRPLLPPAWLGRVLCLPVLVLVVAFIVEATRPAGLLVPLHLIAFFAAAWICHGELSKDRPATSHLTEFYLCLSVGGVLGGMFNALAAPLVFSTVLEYPLVMILVTAIRPAGDRGLRPQDAAWAVVILALTAGLIFAVQRPGREPSALETVWIFAVPALLTYRLVQRPARFALALGAMLLASRWYTSAHGHTLCVERNFFGVLRVTVDPERKFRQLIHSSTIHGRESLDSSRAGEPLAYYHRSGPLGQIMTVYSAAPAATRVAIIGLGAGSMASYAMATQDWTFYEIDPAVERIARDTRYFSFLAGCAARELRIELGDARLRMREAPNGRYGLIVLDAFSSDSIPMHLITREALQLYMAKLNDNGVLAFHISNRRLNLRPAIANLAHDAGLVCLARADTAMTPEEQAGGKQASDWAVMARRKHDLGSLASDARWQQLPLVARHGVWTDDFCNIFSALRWQ